MKDEDRPVVQVPAEVMRARLREAIRQDEMFRRPHVEELVRLAVQLGWERGRAGQRKPPVVNMSWDDEGHCHVIVDRELPA